MHLRCLMNRRHRRIRIVVFVAVLSVGYVGIIFPSVIWNSYTSDLEDIHESHSVRTLLATDDNSTGFQYPTDAFSLDQRANGAIVLHIIGVIYMFVALAIVCDEYFVPSLSVIIERLNISEDVAGATFMAAGGSAPELFTSLIGVFLARNNVGIGTIVGSAVFNILFVIGMCAIVSKTVLDLTWWPLFRDVTFYSISLILLIVFFEDELIEWPEALGLFICYIVYVIFMKFNEKIEGFVKRRIVRRKSRIHSNGNLLNDDINARRMPTRSCSIPILHSGTNHFRHGVLQLMIHTIDPISEGKVHEKAIKLRAVANLVMDSNPSSPVQNGLLRNGDLHNGMPPDQEDRRNGNIPDKNSKLNGNFPDKNRNKQIQIHAISNGHIPRDSPVPMDASPADQTPGNRFIYRTWPTDEESGVASPAALELRVLNRSSNTTEETSLDSSQQTTMTSTRAGMESTDSGDMLTSRSRTEMPKEQDEPLDMSWPSTWRRRVTYVLVAPLIIPMWLTLPDTRRPEKRKWYIVTFVGSIIWIAAFSYLMVWWANTAGETIGIPNEVMGLTVLAAGTSIPDLITSVIVAKKGYGDMAVSSSVGSNIFDITVGLPVPWLLYSAIYGGSSINVDSHGLMCSIVMLFAMLLTVVITIAMSKWKMTKTMGGAMLVLYCAFVVLSVLLELQVVNCPINS